MATVGQLVDQGVRAYVEGRLDDARRLLEDALQKDPSNARARSYLILLQGAASRTARVVKPAVEVDVTPPPAPAAPRAVPAAVGPRAPRAPAPVPARPADLPAPAAAAPPALAPPALDLGPPPGEEEFAPSPWDDGPALAGTIVLESDGGMDLEVVSEKSDLRSLVPEAPREPPPPEGAPPPSPAPSPAAAARKRDVDVWMAAAKDLAALDDFSGCLEMIEKILKVDPEHAEARAYLRQNEASLVDMYESKLGPLGRIPRLAIKPEEVMWLNLDHRAGFLLSQIDGTVDYESLFALSGLPRLDTARILATLIADGVITS
jgi:tetratricopeptide (TPR) repeat protein